MNDKQKFKTQVETLQEIIENELIDAPFINDYIKALEAIKKLYNRAIPSEAEILLLAEGIRKKRDTPTYGELRALILTINSELKEKEGQDGG